MSSPIVSDSPPGEIMHNPVGVMEPTIGEPRNDDRLRVKADLEWLLTPHVTWQLYYSYGDYESNLPRADFTQTIIGTRLQYAW